MVVYWIQSLSPARLAAMERRWSSALTQAQLANPWLRVAIQMGDGMVRMPGVCRLRKMKRKLRAQQNKKSGGDGGSATIRGLVNPEFELDIELYTKSHFDAWVAMVPSLDIVGKGGRTDKRFIDHPLTQLCGVTRVSFLEVDYTYPEAGGPLKVKLGLLGYGQEANKTTVTPKSKAVPSAPTQSLSDGTAPSRVPELIKPPGPAR